MKSPTSRVDTIAPWLTTVATLALLVFSGATGQPELSARERAFLKERFPATPIRTPRIWRGQRCECSRTDFSRSG